MHALSCNIGGLVIARHNEICDELLYLSQCFFTLAYVRAKPLIHQGRTIYELEICQGSDKHKDTRWGVMVWELWILQVTDIIEILLKLEGFQYAKSLDLSMINKRRMDI